MWDPSAVPPNLAPAHGFGTGGAPLEPLLRDHTAALGRGGDLNPARTVHLATIAFYAQVERWEANRSRPERAVLDKISPVWRLHLAPYIPAVIKSVATGQGESRASLRLALDLAEGTTEPRGLLVVPTKPGSGWADLARYAANALRARAVRTYPKFFTNHPADRPDDERLYLPTGNDPLVFMLGELGLIERSHPGAPSEVRQARAARVARVVRQAGVFGLQPERLWGLLPPDAQDTARLAASWAVPSDRTLRGLIPQEPKSGEHGL